MDKVAKTPNVYVIAGPNGAGKTTFVSEFLPDFVTCTEFLNADLIAAGLSPFAPERQSYRAGRLLLERIAELSNTKTDFGFETTLAGRTYMKLLGDLKKNGYQITLFYSWIPGVDLALQRVQNRVLQGGHHVPGADIRRRYSAGLKSFFHLYEPIVDRWQLFDASALPPVVIAEKKQSLLSILESSLFEQIQHQAVASHEQ